MKERTVLLIDMGGDREALAFFMQHLLGVHETWAKHRGLGNPKLSVEIEAGVSVLVHSDTPELNLTFTQYFCPVQLLPD